MFECCIYNTWLINEKNGAVRQLNNTQESFSSVKMRVVSPSVESVIVELWGLSVTFFKGIIQICIENWWRNFFSDLVTCRENPNFFSRTKGKMNTVQWVTEKYRKVYLYNNKEMSEMSFICQWNSKEFHLDRTLFEDISLSSERQESKNK